MTRKKPTTAPRSDEGNPIKHSSDPRKTPKTSSHTKPIWGSKNPLVGKTFSRPKTPQMQRTFELAPGELEQPKRGEVAQQGRHGSAEAVPKKEKQLHRGETAKVRRQRSFELVAVENEPLKRAEVAHRGRHGSPDAVPPKVKQLH